MSGSGVKDDGHRNGRHHGTTGAAGESLTAPVRYLQPPLAPSTKPAQVRNAMEALFNEAMEQAIAGKTDPRLHGYTTGFIHAAHLIGAMSDDQASDWRRMFHQLLVEGRLPGL